MRKQRSTFFERLWLTLIICGQVIVAPAIAFSVTYFIDLGGVFGNRPLLRMDLIPWILSGALGYGMISLILALTVGGWMPVAVAEKGGWMPVLGISRLMKNPAMIDRARMNLLASPSGKMMKIVNREINDSNRELMEVHGGLQLLAAPLQILLAITPLLMLRFVPSTWLIPNRLLELAMIGYLASLAIILRSFPRYAERYVGIASKVRSFLVNVPRINWMFPVLFLWLVGRAIVGFAFDIMQPDIHQWQQISLEKSIIEAFMPVEVEVPETSFLDLLVALAVLPLATFTTMAALGGGRDNLPDWLVNGESKWENIEDDDIEDAILEEDDENTSQNGNDEEGEPSIVKGRKGQMLAALAKAKDDSELTNEENE